MEITEEVFKELSDENVTKKRYDQIVAAITNKVGEIWTFICGHSGYWAFSNECDGEGEGVTFDPVKYREFIEINGHNENSLPGYEYNEGFPTKFLWSDYKKIVCDHVEACKEDKRKLREKLVERETRKKALIASVKNKLTEEELKVVIFK